MAAISWTSGVVPRGLHESKAIEQSHLEARECEHVPAETRENRIRVIDVRLSRSTSTRSTTTYRDWQGLCRQILTTRQRVPEKKSLD
jgi:hypothetical protein